MFPEGNLDDIIIPFYFLCDMLKEKFINLNIEKKCLNSLTYTAKSNIKKTFAKVLFLDFFKLFRQIFFSFGSIYSILNE